MLKVKVLAKKTVEAYVDVEVTEEPSIQGVVEFLDDYGLLEWDEKSSVITIEAYQVIEGG